MTTPITTETAPCGSCSLDKESAVHTRTAEECGRACQSPEEHHNYTPAKECWVCHNPYPKPEIDPRFHECATDCQVHPHS